MTNEKELLQQVPQVEGGAVSPVIEAPRKVEIEYPIQPATQVIEPLETHVVGTRIQEALNKGQVGKDAPSINSLIGADSKDSSLWRLAMSSKKRGAELPS